jgi:hypothetical protein
MPITAAAATVAKGVIGVGASLIGANQQKKAAQGAMGAQMRAAQSGIDEQRYALEQVLKNVKPFVNMGNEGLLAQRNLIGLGGYDAQDQAINQLLNSAQYNQLNRAGQDAILQNASATGGLRGGNTQAALAKFSPQLMQQLIQQQFNNLGGLTSMGANALSLDSNARMNAAQSIGNLYIGQGNAQAQGLTQIGEIRSGLAGAIGGTIGNTLSDYAGQKSYTNGLTKF